MLLHHRFFCPHSRFVRLVLAERGVEPDLAEARPWERRDDFLRLNPEGTTPVLEAAESLAISGAEGVAFWLDDTDQAPPDRRLMPEALTQRVEVRRPEDGVAVGGDVAVALVVGDDEDDVGTRGRVGRGEQRQQRCDEKEEPAG